MIKWLSTWILLILYGQAECTLLPNDLNVVITSLKQCHNTQEYPLGIYDVIVTLNKGRITVTGTLTTSVDLTPPIKAILKVEKDEFGAWIDIPCVNSIGSCTYNDLCVHSVPSNMTCPQSFINNNVPCRCPIPKGNYTIPSSLEFEIEPGNYFSIYSGKYWSKVSIVHQNTELTCYEVYFTLKKTRLYDEKEKADVDNNYLDDRISVTLI